MSNSRVTEYGQQRFAEAFATGEKVVIGHIAIGDTAIGPDSQNIGHPVLGIIPSSVRYNGGNAVIATGMIPIDKGGWHIMSLALMDDVGGILAVADGSGIYKPASTDDGFPTAIEINFAVAVSNAASVQVVVNEAGSDIDLSGLATAEALGTEREEREAADSALSERIRAVETGTGGDHGNGGDNGGGNNGGWGPIPDHYVLGALWDEGSSLCALTRTRDAIGLEFSPRINGVGGSSDFDRFSVYNIRLCNVVDGVVTHYLGYPGFSYNPDVGDVMVEFPLFYYKVVLNPTAKTREFLISDFQGDGFRVSPRHDKGNGEVYDKVYVSAYTLDSTYRSRANQQSIVNITRAAARTGCKARGTGTAAGKYHQYDYATHAMIQLLYIVEAADWDSQSVLGQGFTASSNTAASPTGETDSIPYHSGSTVALSSAQGHVKYRNVVDPFGNLMYWVDGININTNTSNIPLAYICTDASKYADDVGGPSYAPLSYSGASTSGFIKSVGFDPNHPFVQIPTNATGAEGEYIPDRYYPNTSAGWAGWTVLRVGGYWLSGANAGLFYVDASSTSAYSGASLGCRLLCLP